MADFVERIVEVRDYVSPRWTAAREVRLLAALHRAERSVARRRTAAALFLGALLLVVLFFSVRGPLPAAPLASVPTKPAEVGSLFQLPDGSLVSPRSSDARVQPVEVGTRGVKLRLEAGAAKFSVMHDPTRPFQVLAHDVTVTVLGTIFVVALEPNGVRVSVERGRVRVDSRSTTRVLSPGEVALFTDTPATPEAPPSALGASEAPGAPAPTSAPPPSAGPSWRALAQADDYAAALARLTADGPAAVRDTPDDLLLAADVARLGGRPDRAVAPLERVVMKHAGDSRAPLAAFTLGRTLLDQLGRPREAAQAFVTARKLDPGGALAQDALAREVESWSRAGEGGRARARALEYLKLHPHGRRASMVRRLGGVE